jgi:hypothetical protein
MIREILIGDQKFDMNRFGVVWKHQRGGFMYGTHVPAGGNETTAVRDWARRHGATIVRFDGRDHV